MKKFIFIFLILSLVTTINAFSFEVTDLIFTKDSPEFDCQIPSSKSNFNDQDLIVNAWVDYLYFQGGKSYRFEWYSPNNLLAQVKTGSRTEDSNGCSWRSISTSTLQQYPEGLWTVKFYYDDLLYRTEFFNFAYSNSDFEITDFIFTSEQPENDCQIPLQMYSFNDTDSIVNAWIDYLFFEGGKSYRFEWYSPNNILAQIKTGSRDTFSNGCSWRSISIDKLKEFEAGQWSVSFYYDEQYYYTDTFLFTLTVPGPSHNPKIYEIPDYTQTDDAYGGIPGGSSYCAPVTVSNSLMWLDNNGFDKLAPNTNDRKKDQYDIIIDLGVNYMHTDNHGTSVDQLLNGVSQYLSERQYYNFKLKYQGWRYHSSEFSTGVQVPNLEWIKNGIENKGSVWLNVGWYTYNETTDEYLRIGGHWVTLVGYGHNGYSENSNYLIVHDPSTGNCFSNEFVLPIKIMSGNLTGSNTNLPQNAIGYYKMTDGMHVKSEADFGILDGAVVLSFDNTSLALENAINILQILSGINTNNVCYLDINNDSKTGLNEAIYILQAIAELR